MRTRPRSGLWPPRLEPRNQPRPKLADGCRPIARKRYDGRYPAGLYSYGVYWLWRISVMAYIGYGSGTVGVVVVIGVKEVLLHGLGRRYRRRYQQAHRTHAAGVLDGCGVEVCRGWGMATLW